MQTDTSPHNEYTINDLIYIFMGISIVADPANHLAMADVLIKHHEKDPDFAWVAHQFMYHVRVALEEAYGNGQ